MANMRRQYRSLTAGRATATVIAAAAAALGGQPAARGQSLIPVPALINWAAATHTGTSVIEGPNSNNIIATQSANNNNRAVNWDTLGNYLVGTGSSQSGTDQSTHTVTLNTYLQAGGGGGASLGDSNPFYDFQTTTGVITGYAEGGQIGNSGGTVTLPLAHPESLKHLYIFESSGSGSAGINIVLNWVGGATTSFTKTSNDWATTGETNTNYNAITTLSYANSGNWHDDANRFIYDIPIDVGSANYAKTLSSITFSKGNTGSNFNVVGFSSTAVTPTPPGMEVALIGTLGMVGSLVRRRRGSSLVRRRRGSSLALQVRKESAPTPTVAAPPPDS